VAYRLGAVGLTLCAVQVVAMSEQGEGAGTQRAGWSPQDSRAWVITFGATLAANLATVLVVGAALVLLHYMRGNQPHHRLGPIFWAEDAALLVIGAVLGVSVLRTRDQDGVFDRWLDRFSGVVAVLFVLLGLLVLIGAAAGIK
jgi:hypothetical protein